MLFNSEGEHGLVAQSIANMWREHLGVNVQLEQVEKKTFSQRRRSQGFTIARGGWFGDYRDPTTFLDMLRTNDGNNDMRYTNPAYDALLEQAADHHRPRPPHRPARRGRGLMLTDLPLMPIYHYTNLELFRSGEGEGAEFEPVELSKPCGGKCGGNREQCVQGECGNREQCGMMKCGGSRK